LLVLGVKLPQENRTLGVPGNDKLVVFWLMVWTSRDSRGAPKVTLPFIRESEESKTTQPQTTNLPLAELGTSSKNIFPKMVVKNDHLYIPHRTIHVRIHNWLVVSFNPSKKYQSTWIISPNRG